MENEIHAAISARVYGLPDERGLGGRRRYQWHRYDCLRDMEVGQRIVKYVDKREYGLFRTIASRYGRDFGTYFRLHYSNGALTITRTL